MTSKTIIEHFIDWAIAYKELEPDKVKGVYYPKKEHIISLHKYLVENFKYEWETEVITGIYSDANLDFTGLKYYEDKLENKWEDIIYKGARIFNCFLSEGHPFIDGNKRTGFVTLWIFFIMNNYYVKFKFLNYDAHIKKFKKWAMSPNDNLYEIAMWIKENETFGQQFKRCLTNLLIKIKKLIFR